MDAQATAKIPRALGGLQLKADPRLQRRYEQLVVSHLSHAHAVAAGIRLPAGLERPFAATQAAWRFYGNGRISLPQLAQPLLQCAAQDVPEHCQQWTLVALDWCNLHLNGHDSKEDRIQLAHSKDLGYELLTALALSDVTGAPIAPLCLELRAADGLHSTRQAPPFAAASVLDGLEPVMAYAAERALGKTPVFIIDREADSVGHYRQWDAAGFRFVVRADEQPRVSHEGRRQPLGTVADGLRQGPHFVEAGPVEFQGHAAVQYVAETAVVLDRPARSRRIDPQSGKAKHRTLAGAALPLRLIVSEIRNEQGQVLARWLLLSNLPAEVEAARIAVWYYWRWRIESYHKLLKGAGQQVECWQQETAEAFSRRLLVAAMAGVVVWRLARDPSPEAAVLREVLVRLSGRQMKRTKKARGFTVPALLAGLGVLLPMLELLSSYSVQELRALGEAVLPGRIRPAHAQPPRCPKIRPGTSAGVV